MRTLTHSLTISSYMEKYEKQSKQSTELAHLAECERVSESDLLTYPTDLLTY